VTLVEGTEKTVNPLDLNESAGSGGRDFDCLKSFSAIKRSPLLSKVIRTSNDRPVGKATGWNAEWESKKWLRTVKLRALKNKKVVRHKNAYETSQWRFRYRGMYTATFMIYNCRSRCLVSSWRESFGICSRPYTIRSRELSLIDYAISALAEVLIASRLQTNSSYSIRVPKTEWHAKSKRWGQFASVDVVHFQRHDGTIKAPVYWRIEFGGDALANTNAVRNARSFSTKNALNEKSETSPKIE